MWKLYLPMLLVLLIAAFSGTTACADDYDPYQVVGPAIAVNGAPVIYDIQDNVYSIVFPITVPTDGKLTISCLANGVPYNYGVSATSFYPCIAFQNNYGYDSAYINAGLYWVRLHIFNAPFQVSLSAKFESIAVDETEPNDTKDLAMPIAMPGSMSGILSGETDLDIYKLRVDKRQGYSFDYSATYDIAELYLFTPQELSAYLAETSGYCAKLNNGHRVVLEPGDYFLVARTHTGRNAYGCCSTAYTFDIGIFKPVDSITFSQSEYTVEVGETILLVPSITPADHEEEIIFSSNGWYVNLFPDGRARGSGFGTDIITCKTTTGSVESKVEVHSIYKEATTYSLPKTSKATRGFKYSMYDWVNVPEYTRAPSGLNWSSSKPKIASITETGELTCLKNGSTKITAIDKNGKKYSTTLSVVSNQLNYSKPKGKKNYISPYPKRLYYKGNYLYIEVFLYNNTKYNIKRKGKGGYIFELYDLAKSYDVPVIHENVKWEPGKISKGSWKVYKTKINRSDYDGCDLALGQLYPVIYTNDDFVLTKGLTPNKPTLRSHGMIPNRIDEPSDFM